MAPRDEGQEQQQERIFTLTEAKQLIPHLEERLTAVKRGKGILIRTMEEIKKASAKAPFGGGSYAGPLYINALQQISEHLQAIHEMGVLVKDLDIGLCDFPYLMDGRVVYLCWKLGESEIGWWHEVNSGYAGRQPLKSEEE